MFLSHQQQQIRIAATKAVIVVVSGELEERTRLREVLLPRLSNSSDVLREVAASCFSRSLARDLVMQAEFSQIFRLFDNEDPRIRAPLITELQKYIQISDEAARRRLVDADILSALLQACASSRDDIIVFAVDCVLPILGPAISQINGGASVFPLLTHEEPRLRTAAAMSLRNGIDSRHGDVEKMTRAGVISDLYSLLGADNVVRDLWCYILPKAAPYLSTRDEVDILFEGLRYYLHVHTGYQSLPFVSDSRAQVREAASEAIKIMAKTSEVTRLHLFPVLMRHLDDPPPSAIVEISQGMSDLNALKFANFLNLDI
jgi:hypothetical protein